MRDRGRMLRNPMYPSGIYDALRISPTFSNTVEGRYKGTDKWAGFYTSGGPDVIELIHEDHGGVTAVLADGRRHQCTSF